MPAHFQCSCELALSCQTLRLQVHSRLQQLWEGGGSASSCQQAGSGLAAQQQPACFDSNLSSWSSCRQPEVNGMQALLDVRCTCDDPRLHPHGPRSQLRCSRRVSHTSAMPVCSVTAVANLKPTTLLYMSMPSVVVLYAAVMQLGALLCCCCSSCCCCNARCQLFQW